MTYWDSKKKKIKQIAQIASEASKALIFGKESFLLWKIAALYFQKGDASIEASEPSTF